MQKIKRSGKRASVARVDETGLVTALRPGKTIIYAHLTSKRYVACAVQVVGVPVRGLALQCEAYELNAGASVNLNARAYPSNASNREIIYASLNPAMATVDPYGVVCAVSPGRAVINVVADNARFAKNVTGLVPSPNAQRHRALILGSYMQGSCFPLLRTV